MAIVTYSHHLRCPSGRCYIVQIFVNILYYFLCVVVEKLTPRIDNSFFFTSLTSTSKTELYVSLFFFSFLLIVCFSSSSSSSSYPHQCLFSYCNQTWISNDISSIMLFSHDTKLKYVLHSSNLHTQSGSLNCEFIMSQIRECLYCLVIQILRKLNWSINYYCCCFLTLIILS